MLFCFPLNDKCIKLFLVVVAHEKCSTRSNDEITRIQELLSRYPLIGCQGYGNTIMTIVNYLKFSRLFSLLAEGKATIFLQ